MQICMCVKYLNKANKQHRKDKFMEFNWLGVAFVDENLGKFVEEKIEYKMEELREEAKQKFDIFLEKNNLEQVMGVIVQKNSVK